MPICAFNYPSSYFFPKIYLVLKSDYYSYSSVLLFNFHDYFLLCVFLILQCKEIYLLFYYLFHTHMPKFFMLLFLTVKISSFLFFSFYHVLSFKMILISSDMLWLGLEIVFLFSKLILVFFSHTFLM